MKQKFMDIIAQQEAKYPLMEIQDYVKLAYQNEFGPMHLAEKERLYDGIQRELTELTGQEGRCEREKIGNGLSRIPLGGLPHPETDGHLIAELMILTMKHHTGSLEGLEEKLRLIEEKEGSGAKAWLDDYRKEGCPPVSHSQNYRNRYQPHYRVIKEEFADWFSVLSEIRNLLSRKESAVVSIDGRCGSGKTSLAALIREVFDCNVFHMDDFYLPPQERKEDWQNIPAGNMNLQRFRREVLQPVKEGKSVLYRPFDCQTGCVAPPAAVPPAKLTVVEGSYSQHPVLAEEYDLKIFLTCSPDVQKERLSAREGEGVQSFFRFWMPMEERYFAAFDIEKKSDVVVNTGLFR